MRDIKFKKAILTNFRGQSREVVFKDGLTQIIGFNGTGKTSVYVAVKWCFTGVDEQNRTNYDLFDHKLDFTPENAIPAVVETTVDVDGAEYVFKRQAKQKWTRPRGSAEYVKDKSDEYKFYVDGLELSATAYKDKVAEVFCMDVEKLKLCMDVLYYQMLDWKELRKHFADIVGEIKDADMSGDYSPIMPYLEKYKGGEKAKDFLRQQINPLKQQIKEIDADIKATERQLPDLEPVAEAERLISERKVRIAEINKEILGLEEANKPFVEKRNKELAELETLKKEIREKESVYNLSQSHKIDNIERELAQAKAHNADIDNHVKRNEQAVANRKSEIKLCKEDIEDLESEVEKLRAQNKELKSREFSDTVCPNCGQALPADMIAELRTKFYEDIDKQRAPIVERGKKISARLEAQKARLAKLESEEMSLSEVPERIDTDEIQRRIDQAKADVVPFADTEEAKALAEKLNDANDNLTVVPEVNSAELQEESSRLVSDIEELSKIASHRESHAKGLHDISDYQVQKREVGIELAKWEGLLDKLMAREREWADIVRDRANRYLEHSHVEMIEVSKSGEVNDTCTLSINNVDRGVTNHANKTIIGIDISNAICKRYGVNLPLFIDDFEHFTSDMTYANGRQVITLSADKHYTELTIL